MACFRQPLHRRGFLAGSAEKEFRHFVHPRGGMHGNAAVLCFSQAVVFADNDAVETEFFGLGNALFNAVHGANFPGKPHFGTEYQSRRNGRIVKTAEYGGHDPQIHARIF